MYSMCASRSPSAPMKPSRMARIVKLLSMTVEAPLMIDSTEPDVIARALEHVPGRAVVNSVNLEAGRAKIDALLPVVKQFGAAVVALTIDETGMAKTRERSSRSPAASTTSRSPSSASSPAI